MVRPLSRALTALTLLVAPLGCVVDGGEAENPADCPDCPSTDGGIDGMAPAPAPACLDARPPLDLLIVIDDSGSMCEEQHALGEAFEAFDAAIGDYDWRLAVVSTDMNPENRHRGAFGGPIALPVPSLNCVDETGDPHVPDTEDCQDLVGEAVLDSALHGLDERARRFRCMITRGTQGDGFEKPLAAGALALDCDGPNAHLLGPCGAEDAQFLRPGAALAVIYIGDEDDCSDPISVVERERRAICDDDGRCEIPRTENNSCIWFADDLEPVQSFVDQLRRANPAAAGVTALTLTGPRFAPIDGHPVRFVPGEADAMCRDPLNATIVSAECCPEGACPGHPSTVCEGPFGDAFAGNRLQAMAEAFPGACADCNSICEADAMPDLAAHLAARLEATLPPLCE